MLRQDGGCLLQEGYKGLLAALMHARTRAADVVIKAVSALKGLARFTPGSKVTASAVAACCVLMLSDHQPVESDKHSNKVRVLVLCCPASVCHVSVCCICHERRPCTDSWYCLSERYLQQCQQLCAHGPGHLQLCSAKLKGSAQHGSRCTGCQSQLPAGHSDLAMRAFQMLTVKLL